MNIPTEFKGKVYFYWWTEHNFMVVHKGLTDDPDYTLLGTSEELHVKFPDPRAAMVESLRASLDKERAESQRRIAIIQGKIQELLAIENGGDV